MCLAVPSKIISIDNILATVDILGARRDVSIILVPEDVAVGDYVLVHAGFAIKKIDEEAAQESIKLIREYEAMLDLADAEAEAEAQAEAQACGFTPPQT
ncbi:MAG TPA: HypC/HybG/HupF family hydrogenase formation chaperone [Dissulfurispiraceae bacterium]|nr:HypC/HybG/HupF family hydrogenase formation chaperone [Dissulfurispiraceae bacterium]